MVKAQTELGVTFKYLSLLGMRLTNSPVQIVGAKTHVAPNVCGSIKGCGFKSSGILFKFKEYRAKYELQPFNLWLGSFYTKKEPWFHYSLRAVTKWDGTAHSADRKRLILVYVVGVHRSNSHKPKDSRDLIVRLVNRVA